MQLQNGALRNPKQLPCPLQSFDVQTSNICVGSKLGGELFIIEGLAADCCPPPILGDNCGDCCCCWGLV